MPANVNPSIPVEPPLISLRNPIKDKHILATKILTTKLLARTQLVRRLVNAVLRCRFTLAGSNAQNKPGSQICFGVKFRKPLPLRISSVLVLLPSGSNAFF